MSETEIDLEAVEAREVSPSSQDGRDARKLKSTVSDMKLRSSTEIPQNSDESAVYDVDITAWSAGDDQNATNPRDFAHHLTTSNPGRGEQHAAVEASFRPPVVREKATLVFSNSEKCPFPHEPPKCPLPHLPPVSRFLHSLMTHVLTFTQRPYDFLEKQIEHHRRKLARQNISVVFQSPQPLRILLAARNRVAFVFILLGVLQVFFCIDAVHRNYRPIVAGAFRFTPLELRSGSTDVASPHVADFAVYTENGGCLHEKEPALKYSEGKFFHVTFDEDTTMAGFSVLTAEADVEQDPVRFEVSVQRDDGEWEVVGYHRSRISYEGERWQAPRVPMPSGRGEVWLVDMRAGYNWPWLAGRVAEAAGLGLGTVMAGLAGVLGKGEVQRLGRPALYVGWFGAPMAMVLAVAGYCMRREWEEAAMWGVYCAVLAVGTGWLRWRERTLVWVLPGMGLGLIVADLVCHGALIGHSLGSATVTAGHGVLGGCMVGGGLLLWLLSLVQRRRVCARVAEDRTLLAEVWGQVRAQAGAEEALARLARVAAAMGVPAGRARQCHRMEVEGGTATGRDGEREESAVRRWVWWVRNEASQLLCDMPLVAEASRPLTSLDQVYAQATCLHPILRLKVQEWAERSGGMFATTNGGFVRWADARESAEVEGGIKWGQIKAEKRAIEKVIRCYEEDVSRLVDVCRQSIVFATVGELADCLEAMGLDDDVEVERVKNRMRVEESGAESAGFRNVSVNVRVTTADARSLGVDTHVCEIQLLLADFARLQDTQQHRRYLLFRDHARPQETVAWDWVGRAVERVCGEAGGQAVWERMPSNASWVSEEPQSSVSRNPSVGQLSDDSYAAPSPWGRSESSPAAALFSYPALDLPAVSSSGADGMESVGVFRQLSQARLALHRMRHCPRLPSSTLSPVQDQALRAFQSLLFRRNTNSKGKHREMLDFRAAMEAVSVSSVLFIRRPVHGASSKPAIRFFILCIVIAGGALAALACYQYMFTAFFRYPTYRFTAMGLRNATNPPANFSIASFGVATDRCPTLHRVAAVAEAGPTMTVHYHQPVSMNGWWVRTSNASTDLDPVSYLIHGSNDGETWSVVGGSGILIAYFEAKFGAQRGYLPLARNGTFAYSRHNTPQTLQVWFFGGIFFTFVPLFVAVVRAQNGQLDGNAGLVGSGLLITAISGVASGICQFEFEGGSEITGIDTFVVSGMFAIIGITLVLSQRHLLASGIVAMVFAVGTRSLLFEVRHKLPWWWPEPLQMMLWGCLGLCLLAVAIRFHILWASRRMIAGDKRHYDTLWEGLRTREAEAIGRLAEVCARLGRSEGERRLRHLYNPKIVAMLTAGEHGGAAGRRVRHKVPVLDINQIFAQATLLHPMLLSKVQEWAGRSGGMFATTNGGFVRWADARESAEVEGGIKWGQIKAEKRAIEKVIRCYEEDVSRLVDVCRQSIVFATVGELADCLEAMGLDDDVEVERVKNRMRVEESGAESAGFRNVSVNVRVTTADARSLGVDTHVCEIQLLLADFARLQKSQGHKRYVRFRNVRGE